MEERRKLCLEGGNTPVQSRGGGGGGGWLGGGGGAPCKIPVYNLKNKTVSNVILRVFGQYQICKSIFFIIKKRGFFFLVVYLVANINYCSVQFCCLQSMVLSCLNVENSSFFMFTVGAPRRGVRVRGAANNTCAKEEEEEAREEQLRR